MNYPTLWTLRDLAKLKNPDLAAKLTPAKVMDIYKTDFKPPLTYFNNLGEFYCSSSVTFTPVSSFLFLDIKNLKTPQIPTDTASCPASILIIWVVSVNPKYPRAFFRKIGANIMPPFGASKKRSPAFFQPGVFFWKTASFWFSWLYSSDFAMFSTQYSSCSS